jgi:hypothetical protein
MKKSFNIQELLHGKSNHRHGTKPMHPFASRAFQKRDQECTLKHPDSVDPHKYKQNKTNKPPCFIDSVIFSIFGKYHPNLI